MPFAKAWPYVIAVYLAIWLLLMVYMVIVTTKVTRLRKEVDLLSGLMRRKAAPASDKSAGTVAESRPEPAPVQGKADD